jgi:hypothetical protein
MTTTDFSSIFEATLGINDVRVNTRQNSTTIGADAESRFFQGVLQREYRLVDIPLVYHVLPQQGVGALLLRKNSTIGRSGPFMMDAQRDYATAMTNKLFNVYDKTSKQSVQFASFVTNQTIIHRNFTSIKDCSQLSADDHSTIITAADDWQFKMHVIVCEFAKISGIATLPGGIGVNSPAHNMVKVDFRALACYDDAGNFLCDLSEAGKKLSHVRWWRNRSVVVAHEIGHLFGLLHTFSFGCAKLISIPDLPAQSSSGTLGCPGLLPYDKDRNLFQFSQRKQVNIGNSSESCRGGQNVCGSTCASCCTPDDGKSKCTTTLPNAESVSEDMVSYPDCCRDNTPINSCKLRRGIDPLNNVMSYSPDYCMHEFTTGQMTRMMAQIRQYKDYIYCNYGTLVENDKCQSVSCVTTATSPNCVRS